MGVCDSVRLYLLTYLLTGYYTEQLRYLALLPCSSSDATLVCRQQGARQRGCNAAPHPRDAPGERIAAP